MGCATSQQNEEKINDIELETHSPSNDLWKQYEMRETLGRGAFSVVKLGINKDTGEKVAIKVISKPPSLSQKSGTLSREIDIMKTLDHKHIVRFYGACENFRYYFLVLEYLPGGELFDRIVKKKYFFENEARNIILQLVVAMQYCHSRNVVHRDLKPGNLLLDSVDDPANIKVADFGFSTITDGNDNLKTQCGTPSYVAPEILFNQAYGCSCDMWSIGVITFVVLSGKLPFSHANQAILFKRIKAGIYSFPGDIWAGISDEAIDFVKKLLIVNSSDRLTANQALEHEWMTKEESSLSSNSLNKSLETLRKTNKPKEKYSLKAIADSVIFTLRLKKSSSINSNNYKSEDFDGFMDVDDNSVEDDFGLSFDDMDGLGSNALDMEVGEKISSKEIIHSSTVV